MKITKILTKKMIKYVCIYTSLIILTIVAFHITDLITKPKKNNIFPELLSKSYNLRRLDYQQIGKIQIDNISASEMKCTVIGQKWELKKHDEIYSFPEFEEEFVLSKYQISGKELFVGEKNDYYIILEKMDEKQAKSLQNENVNFKSLFFVSIVSKEKYGLNIFDYINNQEKIPAFSYSQLVYYAIFLD